eukprot:Hpha_TRINITY_DN13993_c0_g4::TRINITY_DN13993_c0_g4_i1::g.35650::m.35650/K15119/SLC25A39_40; solute carrier family 25, member 39/40
MAACSAEPLADCSLRSVGFAGKYIPSLGNDDASVAWRRELKTRAGGVLAAYTASAFVVTPFDRVKTLMQAGSADGVRLSQMMRHMARHGGLYRGLSYELAGAPFAVLYFTLYEECRDEARRRGYDRGTAAAGAALSARSIEMSLRAPLELLKTRAQASLSGAHSAVPGGSLYRGFSLLAARDLTFSSVYWSTYEPLRQRASLFHASSAIVGFLAGATAGCIAAFITTPFDVLKTMRQNGDDRTIGRQVSSLWQARGVRGLFAGVGPRLLRLPLGLATFMSVFESAKSYAAGQRELVDEL